MNGHPWLAHGDPDCTGRWIRINTPSLGPIILCRRCMEAYPVEKESMRAYRLWKVDDVVLTEVAGRCG